MTRLKLVAGLFAIASLAGCNCGGEAPRAADAAVSDAAAPAGDGALPAPDGSVPKVDGAVPEADASQPQPDASTPGTPSVSLPAAYSVIEGRSLTMAATASNPEGEALTWAWTQTAGTPVVILSGADTANATLVAPALAANAVVEVTVTVCDPTPLCASATTKVTVDHIPTIAAATATPDPVDEGSHCTLAVEASDPGDTLTYSWTQTEGPAVVVAGEGSAEASFTAPAAVGDVALGFEVEVCDAFDACASRTVAVIVHDIDAPIAKATATPNPAHPSDTVTLDASASLDPKGAGVTFAWSQTAGPTVTLSEAGTAKATFVAPLFDDADAVLSFEVRVCDPAGLCGIATVQVTVLAYGAYVSASGTDNLPWQCSMTKPCKSIASGLGNAVVYGGGVVRIDEGDYAAPFDLTDGVMLECGYDQSAGWTRPAGLVSRIVTSNGAGLRFPAGVSATIDRCSLAFAPPATAVSKVALVTVEGGEASLVDCSLDATDSSGNASSTIGIDVAGPSGKASVLRGRIVGGNGTTEAVGIAVAGGSTLTVDDGTVEGCPTGGATDAAAIRITDGTANITGATLKSGSAHNSCLGLSATGAASTVTVTGCTISGGVGARVAGIAMSSIASGTVSASDVEGGTQTGVGYVFGLSLAGAGTYTVDGNRRILGGASPVVGVGVFLMLDAGGTVQIANNTYVGGGGPAPAVYGVRVESGTAVVSHNTTIEGGAATREGAGVFISDGNVAITDNGTIIGNSGTVGSVPSAYGIHLLPNDSRLIVTGVVTGNAVVEGGVANQLAVGLQMSYGDGWTISGNTLRGGTGDAVWSFRDGVPGTNGYGGFSQVTIDNNTLEPMANTGSPATAPTESGGMLLGSSTGSVTNNRIFAGPGATSYGVYGRGDLAFFHNYVSGGGTPGAVCKTYAMYLKGGVKAGHFDNNIFDTGRVASTRYGVYEEDSIAGFNPAGFFNNDFFPDAGQVLYHLSSPPNQDRRTATEINSIATEYKGNLDIDPLFKDAANGDYHLDPASPLVDKGFTSALGPTTDMDGETRPMGLGMDIGPDEAK
ncbi:MAG: choice-of-anchor Q domain-containing protein [Myxococcales bacterium]